MKVISYERPTGMGALHCTQYLAYDGQWYPVSHAPSAHHLRRENGFEVVEMEAWEGATPADFRAYHRSNSGGEEVAIGHECRGYQGSDRPIE